MRLLISVIAVWAILTSTLVSCNTSGCSENRNAVPLAEFNDETGRTITLDSLSISGVGQPNDSVLSAAGSKVSQVYLPMRPTHNDVSWCLSYKWRALDHPALNDTITFDYSSTPVFASEECGVYYRYRITAMRFTDHLVDHVEIVDSLITNIDKVYIKIFFRTDGDV